jgi:dynein light chain LC8-type
LNSEEEKKTVVKCEKSKITTFWFLKGRKEGVLFIYVQPSCGSWFVKRMSHSDPSVAVPAGTAPDISGADARKVTFSEPSTITKKDVPTINNNNSNNKPPSSTTLVSETSSSSDGSLLQPRFFGQDDMPEEMKNVAVDIARIAIKQKKTNKDRAEMIKKHFDKTFAATATTGSTAGKWHCIVGTDFGSYVTHESQNFVFFQLGAYFVLIFKA